MMSGAHWERAMKIEGEGQLLRIFISDVDVFDGKPLHEAIVQVARSAGLAGATVLRGVLGYGANSLLHGPAQPGLPSELPLVVEIVDRTEKIKAFLPTLDKMVREGLMTLEKVSIVMYRSRGA
jgi:PII-like signaling protein